MTLDCTTPAGLGYIAEQSSAAERFARAYGCAVAQTGDDLPAGIDAVFSSSGRICGVAEIKSRNLSLDELRKFGSYLISYDKLRKGIEASALLHVPFVVIVSLLNDGAMIYWKITDASGGVTATFTVRTTRTQANCNGGSADRANAFLPFCDGRIVSETIST